MNRYFKILGLAPSASESEIKKAYRKKVRLYHPDVSKLPDAEDRFVEITEAYEYLLNRKAGKQYSETEGAFKTTRREKNRARRTRWTDTEREKAKARAREYARQKFNTFRVRVIIKMKQHLMYWVIT
jgi:DnaJ-class molecular chaperone